MNLVELRQFLESKSKNDSNLPSVELSGKSIREILNHASLELRIPVSRLNYEVLSRGTSGLMRFVLPRDYRLLVYRQVNSSSAGEQAAQGSEGLESVELEVIHGAAYLQHRPEGLFLKVTRPQYGGQPTSLHDVSHMIEQSTMVRVNSSKVASMVEAADGDYHFLVEAPHRPENDARAVVHVDEARMKATVTLLPAGEDGADPSFDWLMRILSQKKITHGINQKKVMEITDSPHYHSAFLIASGSEPVAGVDTWVETLFDTEGYHKEELQRERVDFRRAFHISTANAGQVLARIHPASGGTPGVTVYGQEIAPKPGIHLEPPVGKNVEYHPDTHLLMAAVAGEVTYNREAGVIEVQEVHVINGNLTHNIDFPGSVLIKGDVENDFIVRADGNITINGHVGKSQLIAGENINVKSGINGGDSRGLKMIMGRSIFTSYINNIGAEAVEDIELTDGVVNSNLVAGGSVICAGRYAAIVSSYVSAQREIRAEIVGSSSEVATKIQVGVNPNAFSEKEKLEKVLAKHREQRNVIQRDLRALLKQQDLWGNPQQPELDPQYERIQQFKKALEVEEELVRTATNRVREIEQETNLLAQQASISVQKEIHPGVTLAIGNAVMEVAELHNQPVTLRAADGEIELYPFVPREEEGGAKK